MTAAPPETAAAAQIKRMPDGRVGVMDQFGKLVGMHNSHQSALRQLGDYYGQPHAGTAPEIEEQAAAPQQQAAAPQQQAAPQGAGQLDPAAVAGMEAAMHGGMDFGSALIHQHPHANPQQLMQFAHQMGQQHGQNALGAYGQAQPAPMAGGQAGLQDQLQQRQQTQRQQVMPQPAVIGPATQRMM